jgi:hypothetical protein
MSLALVRRECIVEARSRTVRGAVDEEACVISRSPSAALRGLGSLRLRNGYAAEGDALAWRMKRLLAPVLLVTLVLTIAASYRPLPVLVVVLGLPLLGWGFVRPKRFIALALLVCLFGKSVAQITGFGALALADELMVVAALIVCLGPRLLRGATPRSFPGLRWFCLFIGLGVLSALVVGVPGRVLAEGASLAAKGPLLALAVAQLKWTGSDLKRLARGGAFVLAAILFFSVINLLIPQAWQAAVGARAGISYRSALPSLIGPFTHAGELGPIAALGFLAVVAWNTTMGATKATRLLSVGMALTAVLSFRRKTWLGLVTGYLFLASRARRVEVLVTAVVSVLAVLAVFASTITGAVSDLVATYVDEAKGTAARTVMTRDSLAVAQQHFPFGAGFGRFGSQTAAVYYSPEYLARGYNHVWGLSAALGNDRYLTDTMWPAIMGEAGFFGLVAFALALIAIFRRLRMLAVSDVAIMRWVGLTGIAWLVQYLVESMGNPVFVSPPVYVPLFALAGLLASFGDGGPEARVAGGDGQPEGHRRVAGARLPLYHRPPGPKNEPAPEGVLGWSTAAPRPSSRG